MAVADPRPCLEWQARSETGLSNYKGRGKGKW